MGCAVLLYAANTKPALHLPVGQPGYQYRTQFRWSHTRHPKKEKQFVSSQPIALPLTHPVYVMDNKDINEAAVKGSFFSYKRLARYYLNKLTK